MTILVANPLDVDALRLPLAYGVSALVLYFGVSGTFPEHWFSLLLLQPRGAVMGSHQHFGWLKYTPLLWVYSFSPRMQQVQTGTVEDPKIT